MSETILFGPWTGEFGYELSYWLGECRAIRKLYPNHKAIASSYRGRANLYLDFINEFLPHQTLIENATGVSMCWGEVIPHASVSLYSKMPGCLQILPGSEYKGLKLGGGHGHIQIEESVRFQEPRRLVASNQALAEADRIINGRKAVSILSRQINLNNDVHMWTEKKWMALVDKLLNSGFCIINALPRYPQKPSLMTSAPDDRIIDLHALYGASDSLTDMQTAFIQKSACMIATVTGAIMYGYLTGTPFIYMLASDTEYKYKRLYDTWKSRYKEKTQYLFGNGSVDTISVDDCYQVVLEVLNGI